MEKIAIWGVGGGGHDVAEYIKKEGEVTKIKDIDFLFSGVSPFDCPGFIKFPKGKNTDFDKYGIYISREEWWSYLWSGSRPSLVKRVVSSKKGEKIIVKEISKYDRIIFVSGLGGANGSVAMLHWANMAKRMGKNVQIVTFYPAFFQTSQEKEIASRALNMLAISGIEYKLIYLDQIFEKDLYIEDGNNRYYSSVYDELLYIADVKAAEIISGMLGVDTKKNVIKEYQQVIRENDKPRIAIWGVGGGGQNVTGYMMQDVKSTAKECIDFIFSAIVPGEKFNPNVFFKAPKEMDALFNRYGIYLSHNERSYGAKSGSNIPLVQAVISNKKGRDIVEREFARYHAIIFVGGLGGGTATEALPYWANVAKEMGKKVKIVAFTPLDFEAKLRTSRAVSATDRIKKLGVEYEIIDMNQILEVESYISEDGKKKCNLSMPALLHLADTKAAETIKGMIESLN